MWFRFFGHLWHPWKRFRRFWHDLVHFHHQAVDWTTIEYKDGKTTITTRILCTCGKEW